MLISFDITQDILRQALEAGGIGFWMWDLKTNGVYWDRQMYQLHGLSDSEQTEPFDVWAQKIHPSDISKLDETFNDIRDGRSHFSSQYRVILGDGGVRFLQLSGKALIEKSGPQKVLGICVDVTATQTLSDDTVQLNVDLMNSNEMLQEKVSELMDAKTKLESTHRQLLHSQKMESIGRLAGGLAHDFNNLLMGILGYASILKDCVGDNKMAIKAVDTIESSVEKGSTLARQLLHFGEHHLVEKRPVDFGVMVEMAMGLVLKGTDKKTNIQFDSDDNLKMAQGDSSLLFQAVSNIIENAVEFSPQNATVEIGLREINIPFDETHADLTAGNYLKLTVRDCGIGISKENLEKIFEPFFTTKDVGQGPGLGLSVAHRIVQDHGGAIEVESVVNEGTLVTVLLPAVVRESLFGTEGELKLSALEISNVIKDKRILIVDDEDMLCELFCEILEKSGAICQKAGSGEVALKYVSEASKPYDLILLDMIMPGMSGYEVFVKLRSQVPDQKIVILTGFAESNELEKMAEEFDISIVAKPVTNEKLVSCICKAFE